MKEIKKLRKRNEKHFLKENGLIEAQIYLEDIHYLKNGVYEEIDNTLYFHNNRFENKENDFKVYFSNNAKELLEIKKENHFMKVGIETNHKVEHDKLKKDNKIRKKGKIKYPNIFDNVDIYYEILPNKIKENILILNKEGVKDKIEFHMDSDLPLNLQADGSIRVGDLIIEKPYMIDSNSIRNDHIYYEVKEKKIILHLDTNWLLDSDRRYPITIDPTIVTNTNSVVDCYINQAYPNINFNSSELKIGGYVGGQEICRSLLKFDLPTIGTGSSVVDAKLILFSYPENYSSDIENYTTRVNVHQVTKNWQEETMTWNVQNNQYDSTVEDYSYIEYCRVTNNTFDAVRNEFNITTLVKKWYSGVDNYGLLLKTPNEKEGGYGKIAKLISKENPFSSSLNPFIIITYRNQNGIEPYMTYTDFELTDTTSYINHYNGNLINVFSLGKTIGGKLPVSLLLYYNTNDVILKNDYGFGNGYKLNLYQTLKYRIINERPVYEYVDEDGTIHYFVQKRDKEGKIIDESLYMDEDGLSYILQNNIIKDKEGNQLVFENGHLIKIIDTENREIVITYQNDKISMVSDRNNQKIHITYSLDKIEIISPSDTVIVRLENSKIQAIENKIGITSFTYNEHNIISQMKDIYNQIIEYEYYTNIPYKVKKINHYGKDKFGKAIEFIYDYQVTKVKDNKGKVITYAFNEIGNTISEVVLDKQEIFSKSYADGRIYGIEDNKNKVLAKLNMVKSIYNILWNSSFEKEDMMFTSDTLTQTFDNHYFVTGNRSFKLNGIGSSNYILPLPIGYYTFSFYAKANKPFKIQLISNNKIEEMLVNNSEEFIRNHLTIYHGNANLMIKILLEEENTVYIDDIQLEEGKLANYYNLIDNNDFRYSLAGVQVDGKEYRLNEEIIENPFINAQDEIINETNRYFKIDFSNRKSRDIRYNFPIKGKAKDVYYLGFWYKNLGLSEIPNQENPNFRDNQVLMIFPSIDVGEDSLCIGSEIFKSSKEWQYYITYFEVPEDYQDFIIDFSSRNMENYMCITGLTMIKGVKGENYQYDENGNIISIKGENKEENKFEYDKNNQLIQMTNPIGNNLVYEYDKEVKNRVLKGISETGIGNKIKYDSYGNPIQTIIRNNNQEVMDGIYYIRSKGTDNYLKVNPTVKSIVLSSDKCSHDKFKIEKEEEKIKLQNIFFTNVYISNALLDTILFETIKQKDNSYILKVNNQYLTVEDNLLKLSEVVDEENQKFYFEKENSNLYIENNAGYTADGRFIKETIDTLYNKTKYDTNEKGLVTKVTDALDNTIDYTYNEKDQLVKVAKKDMEVEYVYDNTLLSKIKQENKEYLFNYDDFLNSKKISINNTPLIEHFYEEHNGNLIKSVYGNNHEIKYEYDELDRIKKIIKMNDTYEYYYDTFGLLRRIENNDITYLYHYDFGKRLKEYIQNQFKIKYEYNPNNNLIHKEQILGDTINRYDYNYNEEENVIKLTNGDLVENIIYDELQRVVEKQINHHNIKYYYKTNGNRTSTLVDKVEIDNDMYQYKYDKLYNITKIYKNNILLNQYYYDIYNQLIKEENLENIIEYNYDLYGNILNKKIYDKSNTLLTTDTYQYNNMNWKDQLTNYNTIAITYDNIGNPITIGEDNLTWINGRQLKKYEKPNKKIEYKYNKDGIRIEKKINDEITKYYLEGKTIIYQEKGNEKIYFIYDEKDDIIGLRYKGNTYYYIKNIQNDVLGLKNDNLEQIVSYEYDSYGKIKSIKDELGNEITDKNHIGYSNPFRYRSYYYDDETELYYLNSRYYNPIWGRFINSDELISNIGSIKGYNLYEYCYTNPVLYNDSMGKWPLWEKIKNVAKTIYNVLKSPITKKVSKVTSNIVKDVAKSELKKAIVIEYSNGSGYGFGANLNGVNVEVKDVSLNSITTIKPFPTWQETYNTTSEKTFKIVDIGFTKVTDSQSTSWQFNSGNVDISNEAIFIGAEIEAYVGVGGSIKAGLEFDETNLFYHGYKLFFDR